MSSDLFFYTSSDDEDEVNSELAVFAEACQAAYEASKPKIHRTPVERDHYGAHDRLVMAYFSENPQYNEKTFRERFRMSRRLFTKIVREVTDAFPFFQENMSGRDNIVIFSIEEVYFHNWPWKNCPVAYTAQFSRGDHWKAPDVPFVANNVPYKRGYYLTDGIYPQWSVLIKSIKNLGTDDHKRILYKTKQEAGRKDVERAFGVLKKKRKLITHPARGMSRRRLSDVVVVVIVRTPSTAQSAVFVIYDGDGIGCKSASAAIEDDEALRSME
ncbi:ALP1-like protein [Tanacetum coccineum]